MSDQCPPPAYHGAPVITGESSYDEIKRFLLNNEIMEQVKKRAYSLKDRHERGEIAVRVWIDGFFWFPRMLFGIENHLYAFYDQPELMHRINGEMAAFGLHAMEEILKILKPDMVSFVEDMSYNHGPMISHEIFQEFMLPYYRQTVPFIHEQGIKVLVDSDGDIAAMAPWLLEAGLDGIYPLERQAGVDIAALRERFPKLLLMGAFDKMTMSKDESAMRNEFERLLPVMKQGGFVPGVDHQTPPEVSLDNYRIYLKIFREYCTKAVE